LSKVLKYLIDENVDLIYLTQIRRRNPDIVIRAVGGIAAPKKGTLDPEILKWCEEKQFVLVTNNRKSMPPHLNDHLAEGRHIPGIITLSKTMSIGEMIDELIFLAEASLEDEFLDQIEHMPIT
jgi:Domain of unknown function (DUF5615)